MKQTTLQNQHIFISHNSKDKTLVKKIAMWLKEQGLDPWLDEWEIQPGTSIQDSLEKALKNSRAILICIGKNGSGPWHREEIKIAVRQAIHQHKTIIPLFLPGCPINPKIPEFLKDKAGIDFRKGLHDEKACKDLLWSATGINPNHTGSQSNPFTPAGDLYDRPVMQEYARALVHRYEHIDFLGIPDLRDKRAVPLESIFVDLECRGYSYPRDDKALPVKDYLDNEKKLVILGDPGAGKSTLLKHQALSRARALADNTSTSTSTAIHLL